VFPPHHRSPQQGPEEAPSAPRLRGFFFALCFRQCDVRSASVSSQRSQRSPVIQAEPPHVTDCLRLPLQHASMRFRLPLFVLAVVALQAIAGCVKADRPMMISGQPSIPVERQAIADRPIKSYKELIRGFDRTLTETERNALIADLQREGARPER